PRSPRHGRGGVVRAIRRSGHADGAHCSRGGRDDRMTPARAWILLVFALLSWPALARANMAQTSFRGDETGLVLPKRDDVLRVAREDLTLDVDPSLERANVTARYSIANPSDSDAHADVAFAFMRGERAKDKLEAAIAVDGAQVPFVEIAAPDGGDDA